MLNRDIAPTLLPQMARTRRAVVETIGVQSIPKREENDPSLHTIDAWEITILEHARFCMFRNSYILTRQSAAFGRLLPWFDI